MLRIVFFRLDDGLIPGSGEKPGRLSCAIHHILDTTNLLNNKALYMADHRLHPTHPGSASPAQVFNVSNDVPAVRSLHFGGGPRSGQRVLGP